jgi:hypothetical protein
MPVLKPEPGTEIDVVGSVAHVIDSFVPDALRERKFAAAPYKVS